MYVLYNNHVIFTTDVFPTILTSSTTSHHPVDVTRKLLNWYMILPWTSLLGGGRSWREKYVGLCVVVGVPLLIWHVQNFPDRVIKSGYNGCVCIINCLSLQHCDHAILNVKTNSK